MIDILKEKYKDILTDNKKEPLNLVSYLLNKYNTREICNLNNKYSKLIELEKKNCLCSFKGKDLNYEDLNLKCYEIIKDKHSNIYYKDLDKESLLYVIIELNSGYISSNSSLMFRDLVLYQGVSKYDIENTSVDLMEYLRFIDELYNHK